MGATINNESITTEPLPLNRQQGVRWLSECLTQDRGVAGLNLTRATALYL